MPADALYYGPAKRTRVGWLIAIAGGAGSGKTYSALRLATGLAGPNGKIAFADTENGRALYYDDEFKFAYHSITEPFRPGKFEEAAIKAQAEHHDVLIIDNFSHEHTGPGGVLGWHEEELQRLAGEDYEKRERMNQLAWVKPKMARKATLQRFWQLNAHIILCLQAERKTEQQKDSKTGKIKPVDIGFQPVCASELPYFMTASFMLDAKQQGIPLDPPLKMMAKVAHLFEPGKPLDEATGARIAAWSRGEKVAPVSLSSTSNEAAKSDTEKKAPARETGASGEETSTTKGSAPAPADAKTARDLVRLFAQVKSRVEHMAVANHPNVAGKIEWLRKHNPKGFDEVNRAAKASFQRTEKQEALV